MSKAKLGLIVNPVAGIGGRAGLKGSDDPTLVQRAREQGFPLVAPEKAAKTLTSLQGLDMDLLVYPREMGGDAAVEAGFDPKVIGRITPGRTTAEDTVVAARLIRDAGVQLILFAGGDGTARDVSKAVGVSIPTLGIPSGVKTYSAVFGVSPQATGLLAKRFLLEHLPTGEAEVLDIDEEAYRRGVLSVKLYGYLLCPYEPILRQTHKTASLEMEDEAENQQAIARHMLRELEHDTVYVVGPGGTTRAIFDLLGLRKTLLGVDLILDGRIIARDASETAILQALKKRRGMIIVTPTGGQGFLFGRGNQQISAEVIKQIGRENIIVLATRRKIDPISALHVDTGDEQADSMLRGFIRVVVDFGETVLRKVV